MRAEVAMVQEFPVEGVLRIRINTYREPEEVGYEEHHVQVPVIPEGGYPGKVDKEGNPEDPDAYNAWLESLPKVWQNNPCLNQFIRVPIGTPQTKIVEIMREHTKRVKAAPVDPATGLPNVKAREIQMGLREHLQALDIDRMDVKCRSIDGFDAVKPDHTLLQIKVTER